MAKDLEDNAIVEEEGKPDLNLLARKLLSLTYKQDVMKKENKDKQKGQAD